MHLLCECSKIVTLWAQLACVCCYFLNVNIKFMDETIYLNNYIGPSKDLINILIAVMKQYIYSAKCFQKIPIFQEYMSKLADYYTIDKFSIISGQSHMSWKAFHKKWQNLF